MRFGDDWSDDPHSRPFGPPPAAAGTPTPSHPRVKANKVNRREALRKLLCTATILMSMMLGTMAAYANPSPPTNGGNGAGQSGQCPGAAAARPASCQSPPDPAAP